MDPPDAFVNCDHYAAILNRPDAARLPYKDLRHRIDDTRIYDRSYSPRRLRQRGLGTDQGRLLDALCSVPCRGVDRRRVDVRPAGPDGLRDIYLLLQEDRRREGGF